MSEESTTTTTDVYTWYGQTEDGKQQAITGDEERIENKAVLMMHESKARIVLKRRELFGDPRKVPD